MTVTYNLHNCTAWAAVTTYSVIGARRSNSGNAYQLTTTGISGVTGPTGTGASISDGTCVWKYLSAVDYTSLSAAIAGIGTLSQPTVLQFWNDAEWSMATTVSGNSTTSSNTLTLTTAPGEGFRDNANASTNALRYNQANGVAITSNSNYAAAITISEPYVTVSKLMIKASTGANREALSFSVSGGSVAVDGCILDNSGAVGNAVGGVNTTGSTTTLFTNTAMIVSSGSFAVQAFYQATYANCTFVRVAHTSATGSALGQNYGSASIFMNCAFFGFTSVRSSGGATTCTTCGTDIASPPSGCTGSLTYSNQFQDTGSTISNRDYRLKSGANLIDAGTTDTTDIPAAIDIIGTSRPQGSAWDIGAWEYKSATTPIVLIGVSLISFMATGRPALQSPITERSSISLEGIGRPALQSPITERSSISLEGIGRPALATPVKGRSGFVLVSTLQLHIGVPATVSGRTLLSLRSSAPLTVYNHPPVIPVAARPVVRVVRASAVDRYVTPHAVLRIAIARPTGMSDSYSFSPPPERLGSLRAGAIDTRGDDLTDVLAPVNDPLTVITSITVTRRDGRRLVQGDLTAVPPGHAAPWLTMLPGGLPSSSGYVVNFWVTAAPTIVAAGPVDYTVTVDGLTAGGRVVVHDLYLQVVAALG